MTRNVFKTIYLIIISLITIAAVIFGTMLHIGGLFQNNKFVSFGENSKNVEATRSVEAFESIDADVNLAEVIVEYGEEYSVYYNIPEDLIPEIKVENGTLKVKSEGKKDTKIGIKNNDDFVIKITVPEETMLKNIDVDADMGAIEISNIQGEKIKVDADAGGLKFSGVKTTDLNAVADAGGIEVKNSEIGRLTAEASMGSISVKSTQINEGSFKLSMGSLELSLTGSLEKLTADCEMGSVDLDTENEIKNETISLKTDMGSISVNGKDKGGSYEN